MKRFLLCLLLLFWCYFVFRPTVRCFHWIFSVTANCVPLRASLADFRSSARSPITPQNCRIQQIFHSSLFLVHILHVYWAIESFQAWIIYYYFFLACANFISIALNYYDYRKSCVYFGDTHTHLIVYVPGQFVTFGAIIKCVVSVRFFICLRFASGQTMLTRIIIIPLT